jgi:hypothetical protein
LNIQAAEDITIEPNAPDKNGSGVLGTVSFGTSSHDIELVAFGTTSIAGTLRLEDSDAPGSNWLTASYAGGGLDAALELTLTGNSNVTIPVGTITLADTTSAQTLDSKTLTGTTIDASLNSITNLTDTEIAPAAGILGTKIAPDFGSQNIETSGEVRLNTGGAFYSGFKAHPSISSSQIWALPEVDGASNQVLSTDGAGNLDWVTVASDSLPEYNVRIGNNSSAATDTDTNAAGDILASTSGGLTIKTGAVTNTSIDNSAGIAYTKMETLTPSRALQSNSSGQLEVSSVTVLEMSYLAGTTADIQTQFNARLVNSANLSDLSNATDARSNLGLEIGVDVQAWDTQLDDLAGLTPTSNHVIIGDGTNWQQASLFTISGLQQNSFSWSTADGATKIINHAFGLQNVQVSIFDENDEQVWVDAIELTDTNNVTVTASTAPTGTWTVLVKAIN